MDIEINVLFPLQVVFWSFVNLDIGIGIGNRTWIGTDITNVIISSSIRLMDPKLSSAVT